MIAWRNLEWRRGPFRRRLWRELLRVLEAMTPRRGRFSRLNTTPDGTTVTALGGRGGEEIVPPWDIAIEQEGDKWLLRFERGLVNGIEPRIGKKRMSEADPKTGLTPALEVKASDFNEEDRTCRIYAKASIGSDWAIQKLEMTASARTPAAAAFIDHILIALLIDDGEGGVRVEPRAFRDLTWVAVERHGNGFATYLRGIAR